MLLYYTALLLLHFPIKTEDSYGLIFSLGLGGPPSGPAGDSQGPPPRGPPGAPRGLGRGGFVPRGRGAPGTRGGMSLGRGGIERGAPRGRGGFVPRGRGGLGGLGSAGGGPPQKRGPGGPGLGGGPGGPKRPRFENGQSSNGFQR